MSLTEHFKPFTEEDFSAAFQKEVKNGDFRDLLTWKTYEGIDVSPFYHSFGEKTPVFTSHGNDWEINRQIIISDYKKANEEALLCLNQGISSLTFTGKINSAEELEILLSEIGIQYIEINFRESGNAIAALLKKYCDDKNIDIQLIRGSFSLSADTAQKHSFPQMQAVTVDGTKFHNAGGNIVQQAAFLIAEAKESLDTLLKNDFSLEEALRNIRFHISAGPNFFFEIAKIRALRVLWKNVTDAYGKNDVPLFIHTETSAIWLAKEDENNNLIRASFQAVSAVLGGADSLYVHPYSQNNSSRISANVQLVIKEEGFLNKVADAGSGAFYIEKMTHELILKSWNLFQETEKRGGYAKAISSEWIQKEIFSSAKKLKEDIASGKIKVIGVNKHRLDKTEKTFADLKYDSALGRIDLWD